MSKIKDIVTPFPVIPPNFIEVIVINPTIGKFTEYGGHATCCDFFELVRPKE